MKLAKTLMAVAIGSVGIMGAMSAHAVTLVNGDKLTIDAGVQATSSGAASALVSAGSWFALDTQKPKSSITFPEQTVLSQGTNGLVIGSFTAPGVFGTPDTLPTDTGPFVHSWSFNGSTGTNFFNSALGTAPVQTDATHINFNSQDVAWNTTSSFNLTSGFWTPTNCTTIGVACSGYANGSAVFTWDGVYGHTYKLDYTATVPSGSFIGSQYLLHLTGTVLQGTAPVPEASTYGMMLAGLGVVAFAVRRRKLG
jgi:hypothetical protein